MPSSSRRRPRRRTSPRTKAPPGIPRAGRRTGSSEATAPIRAFTRAPASACWPVAPPPPAPRGLSTHGRGLDVDPGRVEVVFHEGGEVYLAPVGDGEVLVAC